MSASGAYLLLEQQVREGAKLSIIVTFSLPQPSEETAARVAARGSIRRVEARSGGRYGIAIEFRQYRFL